MKRLKISAICATLNNGELLRHSILSIIDSIDEILIFDDSMYNDNYFVLELSKYDNVKVIRENFGNDLGRKKQYLNEIAKNNIILRWDNDFILYNFELLARVYNMIINGEIDGAYKFMNINLKFSLNKTDLNPFYRELIIFRKGTVKFGKKEHYSDYPIVIDDVTFKMKSFENEILFLHLSNFKSYENIYLRSKMNPFMSSIYNNYYEFMYSLDNKSSEYDYFDIINFKRNSLNKRRKWVYEYHNDWDVQYDMFLKMEDANSNYDISILNKDFITYINNNYKFVKINENPEQYNFICNETDSLTNLFYFSKNFEELLSIYIYEKLTGYKHKFVDTRKNENTFNYIAVGSIINFANSKSIIWGTGTISQTLQKISPFKICCVRGPRTRSALQIQNIIVDEKYGDPVLLLPLIYKKQKSNKSYKLGIVPDIIDYDHIYNMFKEHNEILVIDLSINIEQIEAVIDQIQSCDFILTSSLYGIIICNSYNVPVIRFKLSTSKDDDIRFIDYFESVYSDKYLCQTDDDISIVIHNFDRYKSLFRTPDLIKQRQMDLVETCPFVDESLKGLLMKCIL
jgi:hypothetical protein